MEGVGTVQILLFLFSQCWIGFIINALIEFSRGIYIAQRVVFDIEIRLSAIEGIEA
jgi:hypothetical protein